MIQKAGIILFVLISKNLAAVIDIINFNQIINNVINIHKQKINKQYNNPLVELKLNYYNYGSNFSVDSVQYFRGENKFIFTVTGALAKEEVINQEAFAIVVCHEIGHVLAGFPKQTSHWQSWSSVEGLADYFATNKCMKLFNSISPWEKNLRFFDSYILNKCQEHYGDNLEETLSCLRTASGIMSLQNYFNLKAKSKISMKNKDKTKVAKTLCKYPSNQCRIDTFWAGLFNEEKPACWFKQ